MYKIKINLKGTLIGITDKSNNITWSSSADTLGDELDFDSLYDIEEGTQIGLFNDSGMIYVGITVKKTEKKFENNYTCIDLAWYLNKSKITMQFNNVDAKTAIETLCRSNNIRCNICAMSTKINKIYKAQEISSIIDDILDQVNKETGKEYIKEMDVITFKIVEATKLKITPSIVIGKDVSLESSIEDMKNSIKIYSNDENNNNVYSWVADQESIAKYGLLQEEQTIDDKNLSQATHIADNFIEKNNKIFKTLSFTALDINDMDIIKANRYIKVTLKDFGIDNWVKIKSVKHTFKNNNHQIDLEFDI